MKRVHDDHKFCNMKKKIHTPQYTCTAGQAQQLKYRLSLGKSFLNIMLSYNTVAEYHRFIRTTL